VRDASKKLVALVAAGEAAMGLALLAYPPIVTRLLLGTDALVGVALVIARVTGIALIGLGVSWWPGSSALVGMLTYSALLTLYLAGVGLSGAFVGILLWPAVALHTALTGWLTWSWLRDRANIG
jgi:hypothetical protein